MFDVNRLGKDLFLTGATFGNDEEENIVTLPNVEGSKYSLEDWQKILYVTDRMPVDALVKDDEGKVGRAVLYKSQRTISNTVSWEVYRRDSFTCRYCGRADCPMTVDHLVLWEDGGPSTVENLVTACSNCNKKRGNMQYENWLKSTHYQTASKKLSTADQFNNERLIHKLKDIPRVPIEQGKKRKRR